MAASNNFAILIARQRSGTGALGSILDQHSHIKYLGEVFHPDNIGQNDNYFTFFRIVVVQDAERALPWHAERNFEEFIEMLSDRYPDQLLVVDVKYRSLHHMNGGWQGLDETPWMLNYARRNQIPIIHLTRKNFVESFVSGRLAEENQVWHATDGEAIKVTSTVLNIRQLSNYINRMKREVALIKRWTNGYAKLAEVEYAGLFDKDGLLDIEIASKLCLTLDVGDFENRKPGFVKQAPKHVSQSIENFELVQKALAGTSFEWMTK